jgi:hypothetical protein
MRDRFAKLHAVDDLLEAFTILPDGGNIADRGCECRVE